MLDGRGSLLPRAARAKVVAADEHVAAARVLAEGGVVVLERDARLLLGRDVLPARRTQSAMLGHDHGTRRTHLYVYLLA